jgi:signal transducing adaptor molecule
VHAQNPVQQQQQQQIPPQAQAPGQAGIDPAIEEQQRREYEQKWAEYERQMEEYNRQLAAHQQVSSPVLSSF